MPKIREIPERYLSGFIKILNTNINVIKDLKKSLDLLNIYTDPRTIANLVYKENVKLTKNEIEDIIVAVGSISSFLEDPESPSENIEIINDIAELFQNENIEGIDKAIVNLDDFKEKLKLLLATDVIIYSFKSLDLMSTNYNSMLNARIISDIRPVFGGDIEEAAKSVIILHNLNIHYVVGQHKEHQDFFVAMDSNDLKNLKEIIERAEKKENTLKTMLKDTKIRIFKFERSE